MSNEKYYKVPLYILLELKNISKQLKSFEKPPAFANYSDSSFWTYGIFSRYPVRTDSASTMIKSNVPLVEHFDLTYLNVNDTVWLFPDQFDDLLSINKSDFQKSKNYLDYLQSL